MAQIFSYQGAAVPGRSHYVMIATPVMEAPCVDYARSLAATMETIARATDIQVDLYMLHGCCHVDDARNICIRDFLDTECTDLFFIDADMGWTGNAVARLLKAPGDVVAGVYPQKTDARTYPFHAGGKDVVLTPNEYGLLPMPKVATGFMRLRRHVVEALYMREVARNRAGRAGDELQGPRFSNRPVARIVERGFPSELGLEKEAGNDCYHSGDYVLSLKARQLGFKLWIDPELRFTHTGSKTWVGHFANDVRDNVGAWRPEFIDVVAQLMDGKDDPETFQRIAVGHGSEWPLAPEPLHALYHRARQTEGDVLELGSGVSTLVLALALKGTDRKVHALEHDALFFQRTGKLLEDFKVTNAVLHLAPLVPIAAGIAYSVDGSAWPARFGLALLDGPPHKYGRTGAVWPLLPQLRDAVLIIDDAQREEGLIELLRANGHDVNIRKGERWWAVGTPKSQLAEAAE